MKYYFWVILFFIIAYLLPLGMRPMWSPEEFVFAQIPYDMISSGNYLPNDLLSNIATNKSFMTYWLTSLSMKLFGANAFGIRFAAALAIGATATFIALFIRQHLHDKRLAALASAIFLSSSLVYFVGIFPLSDSIFTFFAFASLGTTFLAIAENNWNRRRIFMLFLTSISLWGGFFTKGWIAVFIWFLLLEWYLLLERRWKDLFTVVWMPIVLVTFFSYLVGVLKFGLIYNFEDFISIIGNSYKLSVSSWSASSFGYYVIAFIIAIMPGGLLLLLSLRNPLASYKSFFKQDIYKFSLLSTIVPLVVYPFFKEESIFHILLSITFFAIVIAGLVALYLRSGIQIKFFNFLLKSWGLFICVIGFIAIVIFPLVNHQGVLAYFPSAKHCLFIISITGLVAVLSGVALLLNVEIENWRRQLMVFFAGIAFMALSLTSLFPAGGDYRLMPKTMVEHLLKKIDYQLSDNVNSTIVTFPKIVPAVSWICKRKDVYGLESINADKYDTKERLALKEKNLLLSLKDLENKILQLKANERLLLIYWSTKDNHPTMTKVRYSYIYTVGFFALVVYDMKSKMEESEK